MISSPLRYPGGKARLFPYFADLLRVNGLTGQHYCEPYAGGAGLALRLLSSGMVERVSLNDADEAISAFWTSALHHNKELCRLVRTANLNIEEWRKQQEIWHKKDTANILELGFATFYLNRTNRSGIIEGAGPVGGYAQQGKWQLDARFDREKQAASIEALVPFKSRIQISELDALEFIGETLSQRDTFTYLDPPYYVKGSKLYRNFYRHADHVAVREAVESRRETNWVVSYDAVTPIIDIYKDFEPTFYSLSYSAGSPGSGREVIFLSDALSAPVVPGFVSKAA